MSVELSLRIRENAGMLVVDLGGEIDVYTSPKLRERLVALVTGGAHRLVIDLDDVDFIDSTGLGVLVGILKRIRSRNGSLGLVCSREAILRVFKITGLERVFDIHPSVEAATGAVTA
ncbi:MAG: anti-sigma factor antagonist [Nocardioidaceae bacterium]|jgi:anti-sigma B factor antagonist|nr:anti-sigma factor antagonist [Nocardioidaceae bacterium]MDX6307985.1 anti-sigma factor antagonist [Nocardioidaceae bacterium]